MADRELKVRIIGDASSAQRAFGTVETASQSLGTKLSGLAKNALIFGAGAGIERFASSSVEAFKRAEVSQEQLSSAFQKFPQLAGQNADSIRRLNDQLAAKTKFDRNASASAESLLAGFGLTSQQLTQLIPLVQDFAARTGTDLPEAASLVGRALLGNARGLKAVGIDFHNTGSAAGNFAEVMTGLRDKVGGFAEREGRTTSGRLAILHNQFQQLQERIGAALIPVMTRLADVLLGVVSFFTNLNPAVQKAIGVIAGLVAVVFTIVEATRAWRAVQAALDVVLDANPVVLLAVAIAALVAGIIYAYGHFKVFHDAVDFVGRILRDVYEWVSANWPLLLGILTGPFGLAAAFIIQHFDSVRSTISGAIEFIVGMVEGMPRRIAAAAAGMWNGIATAFKSAINTIIRGWNSLQFQVPGFSLGPVHFGGFTLGVPDIPYLASGGTAIRSGLAVVGDAGPELVSLPTGASVIPLTGRGVAPVFNFYIDRVGDQDTVDYLFRRAEAEKKAYLRRNGDAYSAARR